MSGEGEPLLLIMGTSGSIPLWADLVPRLAERYRVIAFDNRGLGGSERGEGPITVASMAEDAAALLEALDVPKAHVMGWSLGLGRRPGAGAGTPASRSPPPSCTRPGAGATASSARSSPRCGCPTPSGTWTRRWPSSGLAFSPQLLDHPDLPQMLEPMLPAFPQNEEQMQVTVEQWDADLVHDTLDRLGAITAPTLVVVGEQDLLTPPWQAKAVADAIPGARYELMTGPGSSHGLHIERPDDLLKIVGGFLDEHRIG